MDIHDARAFRIGIHVIDEIGGQGTHEPGQHQQIDAMGKDMVQEGLFRNGPGFEKCCHPFRSHLVLVHQGLAGPDGVKVEIFWQRHCPGVGFHLTANGLVIHHKGGDAGGFCPFKPPGLGCVRTGKHQFCIYGPGRTGINDGLKVGSAAGYQCTDLDLASHEYSLFFLDVSFFPSARNRLSGAVGRAFTTGTAPAGFRQAAYERHAFFVSQYHRSAVLTTANPMEKIRQITDPPMAVIDKAPLTSYIYPAVFNGSIEIS